MNLKKIQAFLLVIEKGSFSEAADVMSLSQPAVSQQVKSLEEDLGVSLLCRSSSMIEPTSAGRYVYKMGYQLLEQWKELEHGINAFHGTLTGTLRIGASTIPGTYLLPRWLGQYHKKFPNVDVCLEIGDSQGIISRLLNKQVDVCIVGSEPNSAEIEYRMVAEDSLVLISPNDHPLLTAPCKNIPRELLQYDFVLRERGSGTRKSMEDWLHLFGIEITDFRTIGQFGSTESLIAAVEAGLGLGFISQLAATPSVKAGRIRIISIMSNINQKFYICCLKGKQDHPTIKEFVNLVMEQVAK
jgi:DNA-binding transcriptional LysR family regulator